MPLDRWLLAAALLFILALSIAELMAPRPNRSRFTPEKRTAAMIAGGLSGTLELYRTDCGAYPISIEDLFRRPPTDLARRWVRPYGIKRDDFLDGWGRPFRYCSPGRHNRATYDLWSVGRDGVPNTADDLTNWRR